MSPFMYRARGLLLVAVALAWSSGCSDDTSTNPGTTGVATTVDDGVSVTPDVRYAADSEGGLPALLDVYAPTGAHDLPIVVLLHGGGLDKASAQYPRLARELAARGVVVVAPNWGPAAGIPPATDTVAAATAANDGVACALSYVVAKGSEWGADPTRIVLFGHSAGANVASVLMFTYARSVGDGCEVTAQQWQPKSVVLWDGEIGLLDDGLWHNYTDVLPELFAEITPWSMIAPAIYHGPVHLLVTTSFRDTANNCNDLATWTAERDPSGAYQAALEAVDAGSDGCVDIGEVHQALQQVLANAPLPVPVDYAEFTAPTSRHDELADDDLAHLVDQLETWAAATTSSLPD